MSLAKMKTGSILDDKYIIKEVLGSGTYGTVYKAIDLRTEREVAVKVTHGDEEVKERNVCEARFLEMFKASKSDIGKLVVNMESWYETDDRVVIVLEFIPHNLRQIMRRGVVNDFHKIYIYGRQMLEFLHQASRVDFVHCDIKPENILVEEDGQGIKFIDFGISYAPGFLDMVPFIQTIDYRAPDAALYYAYDGRVDLWSVGCILLELMIGYPIFQAKDELELMQIFVQMLGMPDVELLESSPVVHCFFEFSSKYNQWLVKGLDAPVKPIGIKALVQDHFLGDANSKPCRELIRVIESMLRFNPEDRITPRDCLDLPFFSTRDPLSYKNHKFTYVYLNDANNNDSITQSSLTSASDKCSIIYGGFLSELMFTLLSLFSPLRSILNFFTSNRKDHKIYSKI